MHLDPEKLGITAERAENLQRSLGPLLDDPTWNGKITLLREDGSERVIVDRTPRLDELSRWRKLYDHVRHPLFVARVPVYGLVTLSVSKLHWSDWGLLLLVCGMTIIAFASLEVDLEVVKSKRRSTKALFTSTPPGGMMVPEHGTGAPGDPDDPEVEAGVPHVQGE